MKYNSADYFNKPGALGRPGVAFAVAILLFNSGCASIKGHASNAVADAIAQTGTVYASDDDIELVGAAVPFGLKVMESLLDGNPEHRGLLLAAARGFTQYAYVYVELPAQELMERDVASAYAEQQRARRLYLRARDYGLRALRLSHSAFATDLHADPRGVAASAAAEDVALLYWTGLSWAAAISLGKDDPQLVADLPVVEALIFRAFELDETFDHGAIHAFLIGYVMSRQGLEVDALAQARRHFERAVELSDGLLATPYVSYAEAVSIAQQDKPTFKRLLEQATRIDIETKPEWTLANRVMQKRARWLLSHTDELFSD